MCVLCVRAEPQLSLVGSELIVHGEVHETSESLEMISSTKLSSQLLNFYFNEFSSTWRFYDLG